MIGQDELLNKLNTYNIDTFPHSLILLGDEGCGKHLLCKEISKKLNLPLIDITNNISKDYIEDIYLKVEPSIYIINGSDISVKEQNSLLKLIEEPLNNSFIILIYTNKQYIIPTIYSRCHIWEFSPYTDEELKKITQLSYKNYNLIELNTPGKILLLNGENIEKYIELISKILTKIQVASFANMLTIPNKISFKGEKEKLDLKIFKYILISLAQDYLSKNIIDSFSYIEIEKYYRKSFLPKIDQKILLDNFLINLWRVSRDGVKSA